MKKFILLNALLCLPLFTLAMDGEKSFALIAKDHLGNEMGKCEVDFKLAQTIPLLKENIECGTMAINYHSISQKNLDDVYLYALQRAELQQPGGEKTELRKGIANTLTGLSVGELACATNIISQLYREDLPIDCCNAWQSHIAAELREGRGKGDFLSTYFDKNQKLGTCIFDHCWKEGKYEEAISKLHQSKLIDRGVAQEIGSNKPEQAPAKPATFFAKCQALLNRVPKPILGLTFFAACAGLYKLLQQQGLLSF